MKKIVVMVPTVKEAAFFCNPGVHVCYCGVGMAECATHTARIILDEKPDLLILAGIAGTYTDELAVGDTVAVKSEVIADMGRYSEGLFEELYHITYEATVLPEGYKAVKSNTTSCAGAIIKQPVTAAVENMEGAAFFAICAQFGIPAMEIRTISNRVGHRMGGGSMFVATSRLAEEIEKIVSSLMSE